MAYIERDLLDDAVNKLKDICYKNGYQCKFQGENYPITITIEPDMTMDGQVRMLDNPVGHNGSDTVWQMVFAEGDLQHRFKNMTISHDALKKIFTAGIKLQEAFLAASYRENQEAKKIHKQLTMEDATVK